MGTNKGIGDFIIVAPWLVVASYLSGLLKISWSRRVVAITSIILVMVFFLWFFSMGQLTRPGSGAPTGFFSHAGGLYADYDNVTIRYLPLEAQSGFIALASYLTQGYFALYLSLDKPFVPMFGVGNSMFLFNNMAKLTENDDIKRMPYPMRVQAEDGWDAYGNWSSIYPWLASDVSFPGTIVVVFLIGYVFALSWLDTLQGTNPFAVAAFTQFLLILAYFCASNICLQTGENLVSFWATMVLWSLTRGKRKARATDLWRMTPQNKSFYAASLQAINSDTPARRFR